LIIPNLSHKFLKIDIGDKYLQTYFGLNCKHLCKRVAAADMAVVTQSPNKNWAKFGDLLMEKKGIMARKGY